MGSGFTSTTGETIYIRGKDKGPSTNRVRRDTEEDIKKIMYLEEEAMRVGHMTDMLCHITQQLRTLFWMSSGTEPTILARKALQKSNIVAEARDRVLLVWGCNTVDRWDPVPTSVCYDWPTVSYWTKESPLENRTGHLDPHTHEIHARSTRSPCKTIYLERNGSLASLTNGSLTILNGSYPYLRLSPVSKKSFLQPTFLGKRNVCCL